MRRAISSWKSSSSKCLAEKWLERTFGTWHLATWASASISFRAWTPDAREFHDICRIKARVLIVWDSRRGVASLWLLAYERTRVGIKQSGFHRVVYFRLSSICLRLPPRLSVFLTRIESHARALHCETFVRAFCLRSKLVEMFATSFNASSSKILHSFRRIIRPPTWEKERRRRRRRRRGRRRRRRRRRRGEKRETWMDRIHLKAARDPDRNFRRAISNPRDIHLVRGGRWELRLLVSGIEFPSTAPLHLNDARLATISLPFVPLWPLCFARHSRHEQAHIRPGYDTSTRPINSCKTCTHR